MSKAEIAGLKLMLSTGEYADVHFLVGDEDAKELVPAHKLVLVHASDVFEAMFRFDANKEQGENANCPSAVEVPDVEAAAFKVMLSFIYTDDLSEVNGENAMAVLYAAKKYNIIGLVDASLQIPISELPNVFFAYAYACLFELEIDQKMLSGLLESDLLLFSDEFQIWKAVISIYKNLIFFFSFLALRWADEKCGQNGIECSSENRRSLLGPALFKIRFPNIHEEDFSKGVVPFAVLTMKEVYGIYQYNSHPYFHGRIFDWNTAKGNRRGTLALEIKKLSEFAGKAVGSHRFSNSVHINGVSWRIGAQIRQNSEGKANYLGFYLWYNASKEARLFMIDRQNKIDIIIKDGGVDEASQCCFRRDEW
ncbi:hypothetical protein niasHT_028645 [Heterodera trifolii]|uniref:BTB domain-containing protein n=1 Tax=Heterodera trifolii TaxID=157864 RepID=A0ABD2KCQ6_9BILA